MPWKLDDKVISEGRSWVDKNRIHSYEFNGCRIDYEILIHVQSFLSFFQTILSSMYV